MNLSELQNRYTHHVPPTTEVGNAHSAVRLATYNCAEQLTKLCPPSRELSLAMTNLEQARMWANAALACNQGDAQTEEVVSPVPQPEPKLDWFDRLCNEAAEVAARFNKLGEFLDSPAAVQVNREQINLMVQQRAAMGHYHDLLQARIDTEAARHGREQAANATAQAPPSGEVCGSFPVGSEAGLTEDEVAAVAGDDGPTAAPNESAVDGDGDVS